MSSTTTQTSIVNRGLQILGYKPIATINDNDRGARAMARAYPSVFLSVLRSNFWSFAIRRAVIAASTTTPAFGKANYFPLPGDFIMVAPPDQNTQYQYSGILVSPGNPPNQSSQYNDWQIENMGGQLAIASNNPGPLYLRYMSNNLQPNMFDPSFAEAFSALLAVETGEELTNSTSKVQYAETIYDAAIEDAKKRNAFESQPARSPVDPWILTRL